VVSRQGVSLAIRTAAANASDHRQILPPVVLDFPKVGGKPGRPKEYPDVLYADRGYDSESTRLLLRWLGIEPRIAKRNTPHGSGLGKVRWVVERTISWIKGLRRMRALYDRLGGDPRCLHHTRCLRRLLPHPQRWRHLKTRVFVSAC
jgi:transposase